MCRLVVGLLSLVAGQFWQVDGPCGVAGPCVTSGNYPSRYTYLERCTISPLVTPQTISFVTFSVGLDQLTINGVAYDDSNNRPPDTIVVSTDITWESANPVDRGIAWKFCSLTTNPTTSSPTTLSPSTLSPTTSSPTTLSPSTGSPSTLSPSTGSPSTLSPSTGSPSTLSPSPSTGSPSTLSPSTLSPSTLSPSTLSPSTLSPTLSPYWQSTGPCQVAGLCVSSANFPSAYTNGERCTITPLFTPQTIHFEAFTVEVGYDNLTIEGTKYSGFTAPPDLVVSTDIFWATDNSGVYVGWKFCTTTLSPTTISPSTLSPTTLSPTTPTTTLFPTTSAPTRFCNSLRRCYDCTRAGCKWAKNSTSMGCTPPTSCTSSPGLTCVSTTGACPESTAASSFCIGYCGVATRMGCSCALGCQSTNTCCRDYNYSCPPP